MTNLLIGFNGMDITVEEYFLRFGGFYIMWFFAYLFFFWFLAFVVAETLKGKIFWIFGSHIFAALMLWVCYGLQYLK